MKDLWNQPLSLEEFAQREQQGAERLEGEEEQAMLELHRWFMKRYPTVLDRMKYIRRQTSQVLASQKHSGKE
jgi:hypothetical protein